MVDGVLMEGALLVERMPRRLTVVEPMRLVGLPNLSLLPDTVIDAVCNSPTRLG